MIRRSTAARGLAIAAVLSVGLAACSTTTESGGDGDGAASQDPLIVGTILPLTGTLASLGPPEVAGVGLAIDDINAVGGVLGNDVTLEQGDSGDTTDTSVAQQTATDLISKGAQVVIGAASSQVSLNVVDQFTEAGVMQVSPANTAADLSGASDFFARTAPPDTVQGAALGSLILDGGHQKVAMIVQDEAYGTGLRDHIQEAVEAGGGEVVYGASDAGDEFPPGESNFSTIVTEALAAKPDAIAVIAFEETKAIISELTAQDWDFSGTTYFCDGNTQTYEPDFDPGTLEGVVGTIPGAQAPDDFKDLLNAWYEENEGEELTDYSYGPESYDAVILAALAAVRGEGTDGATISENIKAVSGADGGTEVTTFEEGVAALEAGEEIHYVGQSGVGPLNEQNDPTSAFIGVYKYDKDNVNVFERAIEGKVAE
ncbi:branched-chain amino acid transport system substrate-binding protein [Promicromonospora umidemergens]|uniref:ABC transporter substrate-binding protein n=1 Tax=Promicromonospora umidemergens TaxID=629679 RepID=A0ABP8WKL4_9MICO|nr:ABC transporter substrate-binding protein [Promicromonospora umidemergens]MCP2285891.1 branched-chain amino acid transport system substrate-binding protein [Promicromonospora umidemergens]